MNSWVDFQAVKSGVSMAMLLQHYRIEGLRRSGHKRLRGRCPIHRGDGTEAFHIDLNKNVFHCFSCQAHGNVLDLVAALEKCSVREAALRLQDWFSIYTSTLPNQKGKLVTKKEGLHLGLNPALSFRLLVDHKHPYLATRGIEWETATHFGVGFYGGPGLMRGRMVIPIHDEAGRLVAYCGRTLDGSEPRYKFPPSFHKSQVLFHLDQCKHWESKSVIVVEGFFGCMKVYQAGFPVVLALMGSTLSERQAGLLLGRFQRIVLLLDGDAAGYSASLKIADRLVRRCRVDVVQLAPGQQPDQFGSEMLNQLLSSYPVQRR